MCVVKCCNVCCQQYKLVPVYTHVYVYIHIFIYIHICPPTARNSSSTTKARKNVLNMYIYAHVYICIYGCTYVYTHIYIYIYVYTNRSTNGTRSYLDDEGEEEVLAATITLAEIEEDQKPSRQLPPSAAGKHMYMYITQSF